MRILFLGSGEFGVPTLAYLHQHHEVAAVVSQPDRPAGRHRQLTPTPVSQWAQRQGLVVLKCEDVNEAAVIEKLAALRPDASVVIAFGQKLSPALVEALGPLAVNLHASLLPKYRGAAPINWAMIHDEQVTGVSVIALAQRMDAGAVYATSELTIDPHETAGELHDRLAALGPGAVGRVLDDLKRGQLRPREQNDELASRAPKLTKADGTVAFDQPANLVRARVHGLTPWPGCRVRWQCQATGKSSELVLRRVRDFAAPPDFVRWELEAGALVEPGRVMDGYHVLTAGGTVKLLEVQVAGSKPMSAEAFAHGHGLGKGDRLTPLR
jgi:methionyl-tRNA formyltransferase